MRAAWTFAPLRVGAYDLIVADPPWPWAGGKAKAGELHYRTMRMERIAALPVAALAKRDAILLLWATGPLLDQAILTARVWGFTYKSHIIWRKTTVNDKPRMGCGFHARSMHETVLIATRGTPRALRLPSVIDGVAREHSRKPDEFYELVRRHSPRAKRCDLFSRETRPGFDGWGNQHGLLDAERLR